MRAPCSLALLLSALAAPARGREVERDAPHIVSAPQREPARSRAIEPGAAAVRTRRPTKLPVTGVLNVNRATEAELKLLPGIGRGRAHAIVERRNKRPFSSIEELSRMKGMKGVVHRLRSHLTVDGETTLRPAGA